MSCDLNLASVINICIPCNDKTSFVKSVAGIITHNTKLVIIHSSILLGVIEHLKSLYSHISIVHSPVRGVHPDLADGIRTFVKYIGHADNDTKSGNEADIHLQSIGIKTCVTTCKNTILAKLLSTTYYGMCIAFNEDMGKICDDVGGDFGVIQDWTRTYNDGYSKLNKSNVTRPVLSRIPDGKHIGGHCVIPNAKLLKSMFPSIKAFDYILQYS